jgi:hypothetical protein
VRLAAERALDRRAARWSIRAADCFDDVERLRALAIALALALAATAGIPGRRRPTPEGVTGQPSEASSGA